MKALAEQKIVTKTLSKPNWGSFKGSCSPTIPCKMQPLSKKKYPNQATVGKL